MKDVFSPKTPNYDTKTCYHYHYDLMPEIGEDEGSSSSDESLFRIIPKFDLDIKQKGISRTFDMDKKDTNDTVNESSF
jgi:hypothetical protein